MLATLENKSREPVCRSEQRSSFFGCASQSSGLDSNAARGPAKQGRPPGSVGHAMGDSWHPPGPLRPWGVGGQAEKAAPWGGRSLSPMRPDGRSALEMDRERCLGKRAERPAARRPLPARGAGRAGRSLGPRVPQEQMGGAKESISPGSKRARRRPRTNGATPPENP